MRTTRFRSAIAMDYPSPPFPRHTRADGVTVSYSRPSRLDLFDRIALANSARLRAEAVYSQPYGGDPADRSDRFGREYETARMWADSTADMM